MNRSTSSKSSNSPISPSNTNTNTNTTPADPTAYMNPNSPYVIAAAHHKHGCCTGRYHCDGSKCPEAHVLNPAIGIPLAVCTGGLSAAAFGMYRGIRDRKYRKEMAKAYKQAQEQQSLPPTEFVTPSSVAQSQTGSVAPSSTATEKTAFRTSSASSSSSSKGTLVAEMPGDTPGSILPGISEKMDDGAGREDGMPRVVEKMDDGAGRGNGFSRVAEKMNDGVDGNGTVISSPSEMEGSPVDTLPRYSELGTTR